MFQTNANTVAGPALAAAASSATVSPGAAETPGIRDQDAMIRALIDGLKVSAGWDLHADQLAGRLHHRLFEPRVTKTVAEYLGVFTMRLSPEVSAFFRDNAAAIDEVCSLYSNGPDYEALMGRGYLSAARWYDTYLLRTPDGAHYESVPFLFARISAFCACQARRSDCLSLALCKLQATEWGVQIETDMDIFNYFFRPLSTMLICGSTPIIRSAGLRNGHLASCFLVAPDMTCEEGTVRAMFGELCPLLAAKSGVGMDVTRFSHGNKSIVNALRLVDSQVEYFNDNAVRPVSVATYMELWHYQIQEFLAAKLPENPHRCNNIFQGVMVSDLFFRMYKEDPTQLWHLFDPREAPELSRLHGTAFDEAYLRLVRERRFHSAVPIKSLMFSLISTIIKTGSPYVLSKDACNRHHWYDTSGDAITCANLCAEVIQHPSGGTATCNLANVCLPRCLVERDDWAAPDRPVYLINGPLNTTVTFCFKTLRRAVEVSVFLINCAIEGGISPTPAVAEGQRERSMGVGVQGLADVFAEMGFRYGDPKSEALDGRIFENMYYWAVYTSCAIVRLGETDPFTGWERSRLSAGVFHWQTWDPEPVLSIPKDRWDHLRRQVVTHGTYNCQFIALMPTVGSSQLTGYAESFAPFFANISSKVTNKEEIIRPNPTFLRNVRAPDMRVLRYHGGDIPKLPSPMRLRYSAFYSAFDEAPEEQLRRARIRAPFVDQSQSFSLFLKEQHVQSASYMKNLLMLGNELGLKTIMYYCRVQKQTSVASFQCLNLGEEGKRSSSSSTAASIASSDDEGANVDVGEDDEAGDDERLGDESEESGEAVPVPRGRERAGFSLPCRQLPRGEGRSSREPVGDSCETGNRAPGYDCLACQ
ncbi:ribonucleoside-diphosphate reductase large subunit [Eptesicus fuscus gammaherpesvirus]|uniref:Ribonucleoside-diphosphate reductase large subunit n=1 Tax=vespertilionid gammaherpesvirus 3 TaxID=2846598 RepID=A0A2D1AF22_9GAMA|nr:ribonucleoside-diphosphate reductase large subunit [Eptesicus fuscus gammaherpesvirus]ATA58292.1 ribonucleoside-diphosphate reductase large subunit [Eptesicus fuscus gammaherpesvirus]WAH70893.1 ribonucleoside-diphosphate reductase large subunit [Eptesicus fuscus gammaherpesvirus]